MVIYGAVIICFKDGRPALFDPHHYMVTENLISVLQRYLVVLQAILRCV